jgi:hypothetical protein
VATGFSLVGKGGMAKKLMFVGSMKLKIRRIIKDEKTN